MERYAHDIDRCGHPRTSGAIPWRCGCWWRLRTNRPGRVVAKGGGFCVISYRRTGPWMLPNVRPLDATEAR